ncbi:MAG: FdrA family protein [Clostridiales bacterium]|nr:FdrA family protein [Clostridiales bacterium]
MLFTVVEKNSYQDSVNLMLLTKSMSSMEGINRISVMMGTPANKDIFKNTGLFTEELNDASPNDICIVVDTESKDKIKEVMNCISDFLKNQNSGSKLSTIPAARTWDKALIKLPEANLAVISIAGEYAADEADKALERGLNVFLFSDNISIKDEKGLKEKARGKGLIVMGPDCGTGILSGVPIAFSNVIEKGNIGIIGASGTGIQEVTSIISRIGGGITHAIGIGGRDLTAEIGGISAVTSLDTLAGDPDTDVIVFISKPPAPQVRNKVVEKFITLGKPVIAIFIGEKPKENHDNVYYTWTLEETAYKAVEVSKKSLRLEKNIIKQVPLINKIKNNTKQRCIKGLFCGGTLAAEASMIIRDEYDIEDNGLHPKGVMLEYNGHKIIDLGDDVYTRGRPHPMIDPSIRVQMLKDEAAKEETAVILLDNVIGYGGHDDMAGVFAPVIKEAIAMARTQEREIIFIASVTGTEGDPQVYSEQVKKLKDAGVIVLESNASAAVLAVDIVRYLQSKEKNKEIKDNLDSKRSNIFDLLSDKPRVVNVGLKHFAETIEQHGGQVLQFNWAPVAGGNKRLNDMLAKLK